jgi:hypothetical protein
MMKYAECSGNIINLCTKMEKNETWTIPAMRGERKKKENDGGVNDISYDIL